ncbi:glycosyltransferase family 2 protein [Streptomyces jeddahensis]|uniref:Putative glycosyltransferase EpsJ n=1 Tax=Streptomyces jeddahensis TaxID=1716141 RepID=A0A177HGG5_9ACTN|nr:glycosyltransferase [Streptomyces jeddahensis]OAH10113.1 putative glycosyltransferase EpsJ [Streptomyces jeddahensis]
MNEEKKWISVIIPVYNAVEYLSECLGSLVRQTIGFDNVEVIAVNDGSTDGSGELLHEWAQRYSNVKVIHQENSGAPGGPRNRGIESATGEFLFFADPDDFLGDEALERMVSMARRNDSDVVLGRIRGVGRSVASRPFARNIESGDIYETRAIWSLTAHKLFRRSLVMDHGLRFTEGVRLSEEVPFVVRAYFLAKGISVVSDYDCYYLVRREGFPHLTLQTPDPGLYFGVVRDALTVVVENTERGANRNALLLRWVRGDILGRFGYRFLLMPRHTRSEYVRLAGALLEEFAPDDVIGDLSCLDRWQGKALRDGRVMGAMVLALLKCCQRVISMVRRRVRQ